MIAQCPFSGAAAYLGFCTFVDDVHARAASHSSGKLVKDCDMEDAILCEELVGMGVELNSQKAEVLIEGPAGKHTLNARYLGGRITANDAFAPERQERVVALRRGWSMLSKF